MSMLDAKLNSEQAEAGRLATTYAREMLLYVFADEPLGGGAAELERLQAIERRARSVSETGADLTERYTAAHILGDPGD